MCAGSRLLTRDQGQFLEAQTSLPPAHTQLSAATTARASSHATTNPRKCSRLQPVSPPPLPHSIPPSIHCLVLLPQSHASPAQPSSTRSSSAIPPCLLPFPILEPNLQHLPATRASIRQFAALHTTHSHTTTDTQKVSSIEAPPSPRSPSSRCDTLAPRTTYTSPIDLTYRSLASPLRAPTPHSPVINDLAPPRWRAAESASTVLTYSALGHLLATLDDTAITVSTTTADPDDRTFLARRRSTINLDLLRVATGLAAPTSEERELPS